MLQNVPQICSIKPWYNSQLVLPAGSQEGRAPVVTWEKKLFLLSCLTLHKANETTKHFAEAVISWKASVSSNVLTPLKMSKHETRNSGTHICVVSRKRRSGRGAKGRIHTHYISPSVDTHIIILRIASLSDLSHSIVINFERTRCPTARAVPDLNVQTCHLAVTARPKSTWRASCS